MGRREFWGLPARSLQQIHKWEKSVSRKGAKKDAKAQSLKIESLRSLGLSFAPLREQIWLNVGAHLVPLGDHLVGAAEHGARAGTVGLADQPFALHHVEDGGGATVADTQATLQHRR